MSENLMLPTNENIKNKLNVGDEFRISTWHTKWCEILFLDKILAIEYSLIGNKN